MDKKELDFLENYWKFANKSLGEFEQMAREALVSSGQISEESLTYFISDKRSDVEIEELESKIEDLKNQVRSLKNRKQTSASNDNCSSGVDACGHTTRQRGGC